MLSDSIAKYVAISNTDVLPFRGITITGLSNRIRFDGLQLEGYSRILVHVGTNDLSNMFRYERHRRTTIFDIMERYTALRNSIRRRNKCAVIMFTSILPRAFKTKLMRSYITGVNFALEKFCARSDGTRVYIPAYKAFMSKFEKDQPNKALFSENDGLHLEGPGVDKLEAIMQQAFSTEYLIDRVSCGQTLRLRDLSY